MSIFFVQQRHSARERYPRIEEKIHITPQRWRHSSPHRRWYRRMRPLLRFMAPVVVGVTLVAMIITISLSMTGIRHNLHRPRADLDSSQKQRLQVVDKTFFEIEPSDIHQISLSSDNSEEVHAAIGNIAEEQNDDEYSTVSTRGKTVSPVPLDKANSEKETKDRALDDEQATMPIADRKELEAVMDSDQMRFPIISSPEASAQERPFEKESADHLSLEDLAENLPDFIYVPFEDAVKDETLVGWEDEWVSSAIYQRDIHGPLKESPIDFIYLWVNGSEQEFQDTKHPWEVQSVLNDAEGKWLNSHGTNRYRDWDELRYSFRSIERNAGHFRNNIQVLVNSIGNDSTGPRRQMPTWLDEKQMSTQKVQVLSQEDFFEHDKRTCLPTFNSLTMENQIFNTPSDTDQMFTLSDDMLLTREHEASDIHSPLFGPVMSFKTNAYNTRSPPTDVDAARFGEKPYLIYTSWLLNRRFGIRKRKGQTHFGHSLSRKVMKEAINAFPGPELRSACKRFRGEPGFQLYSWYIAYHYLIERHREALLWSYILKRSDVDNDGMLSWTERQAIITDLEAGMKNVKKTSFRRRNFYHVPAALEKAGLAPPKVNTNTLWTSLDGPVTIQGTECENFDVNECLAPGFSTSNSQSISPNLAFSSALIFDRLARQNPECGDCLIKIILSQQSRGLAPLLPDATTKPKEREMVVKALMRYKYSIIDPQSTLFAMVTDADQVDSTLTRAFVREHKPLPGQMCLNDDVDAEDPKELQDVYEAMSELFQGLFPEKSAFEL